MNNSAWDVVVIGGGPAGATAALQLARAGRRVLLMEKSTFPRFHIGESFLPGNYTLMCDLGLEHKLSALPHVPKHGAEFALGYDRDGTLFYFSTTMCGRHGRAVNIERSVFDAMLLDEARLAGASVHQDCSVQQVLKLSDGDVRLSTSQGEVHASCVIDASGQNTVIGRHLGLREKINEPHLQKVAYFQHFDHVARRPGIEAGHPAVAMCDEGWFWMIPLNETRTSVGLVAKGDLVKRAGVPANRLLKWAVERCPFVRERMKTAMGPDTNHVAADFSYTCKPYAGQGYFLVGDAALFLDPVFSTGAHLGMSSACAAAGLVDQMLSKRLTAHAARLKYIQFMRQNSKLFFRVIRHYYKHDFRELFLHGHGPLDMHRAVLAVLAGNALPRAPWNVLWRFWMFEATIALHHWMPVVPRRKHFSLLDASPEPLPADCMAAVAGSAAS